MTTDEAIYRELFDVLSQASVEALEALADAADAEDVCAVALYSDASAMSIDMVANTTSHLEEMRASDPDDALYYKWSPGEWALEGFATSAFAKPGALLRKLAAIERSSSEFERHRDRVFEVGVHVLEGLRKSRALDRRIAVFAVSDYSAPDSEIDWIARLNSKHEAAEFERWIESLDEDEED
jgi:hypothetical protein